MLSSLFMGPFPSPSCYAFHHYGSMMGPVMLSDGPLDISPSGWADGYSSLTSMTVKTFFYHLSYRLFYSLYSFTCVGIDIL